MHWNTSTTRGRSSAGCWGNDETGRLGYPDAGDAFLRIDLHLKELGDERAEAQAGHLGRIVFRIEYGQLQNGAQELLMAAKLFGPLAENLRPFFLVLFVRVATVEDEFQLIITVILKPVYTRQQEVELTQVVEVVSGMFLDAQRSLVDNTQGVESQQVGYLHVVDHVVQKVVLQGDLYIFEYIILISRKKLSLHGLLAVNSQS